MCSSYTVDLWALDSITPSLLRPLEDLYSLLPLFDHQKRLSGLLKSGRGPGLVTLSKLLYRPQSVMRK